jgi:hypothetical protein
MLKQIMMVITVRIFGTLIEASLRTSNRVYKSDGTALLGHRSNQQLKFYCERGLELSIEISVDLFPNHIDRYV